MKVRLLLITVFAMMLLGVFASAETPEGDGSISVKFGSMEARFEKDGLLSSISDTGVEWLNRGAAPAGAYFYQNGIVPATSVIKSGNGVIAKSDKAEVVLKFGGNAVSVTATNRSEADMKYFFCLSGKVDFVSDGKEAFQAAPFQAALAEVYFYNGVRKAHFTGLTSIWPLNVQIVEIHLTPKKTQEIEISFFAQSSAEKARLEKLRPEPLQEGPLLLFSPAERQVFQRITRKVGQMVFSGKVNVQFDKIECRMWGADPNNAPKLDWTELYARGKSFYAAYVCPAGGWYSAEVRVMAGGKQVAIQKVERFGVGEVFVGAGQSNSTNCGEEHLKVDSDFVSSYDGSKWVLANDPQPGPHDKSGGGSFWPAFGNAMYKKYGVPIGVAVTGHGGTSVASWQPGGDLFAWMMARIGSLGPHGFRGVLWHQGESDVSWTADQYYNSLATVIMSSKQSAGWEFPWFVAQATYHNAKSPSFPGVREAQKRLWDNGIALEGPDTDTLGGDNRDQGGNGIHFSGKGLRRHGEMWAEKVIGYLDKELGREKE